MVRAELAEHIGKNDRTQHRRNANPDDTASQIGKILHFLDGAVNAIENILPSTQEHCAGRRQ